jgi:hypothetical protein
MTIRRLAVLSVLIALALVSEADAKLQVPRAEKASKTLAKAVCASVVNDPVLGNCTNWTAGPCRRVSDFRVSCDTTQTFDPSDGSQVVCGTVVQWTTKKYSSLLHPHPLKPSCREVKPPTTVPLPQAPPGG